MRLLTHEQAVQLVIGHGVIVYPTSTLYGIGCNAFDRQAVNRVAAIKNDRGTGFICLVSGIEMAKDLAIFRKMDLDLASRFWPGPLTLVLDAKPGIEYLGPADGTIALRCDEGAMSLVEAARVPIISTSANLPKGPSARTIAELDPRVLSLTDGVLPGASPLSGRPSTIVRCGPKGLEILRAGAIAAKDVMNALRM